MRAPTELAAAMDRLIPKDSNAFRLYGVFHVPGRDIVVATDGHVAVIVPTAAVGVAYQPAPDAVTKALGRWLDGSYPVEHRASAKDLKSFLHVGAVYPVCGVCGDKRTVECSDCEGTGEEDCECQCGHSHEAICSNCDGKRVVDCEKCVVGPSRVYVKVFGGLYNRAVLARPLAVMLPDDDEEIVLSMASHENLPSAVTRIQPASKAWTAIVMGCRPGVDVSATFEARSTWPVAS